MDAFADPSPPADAAEPVKAARFELLMDERLAELEAGQFEEVAVEDLDAWLNGVSAEADAASNSSAANPSNPARAAVLTRVKPRSALRA